MRSPSLADVESALFPLRVGRRLVLERLVDWIGRGDNLAAPWLMLTRLFARVKSADSLLEKAQRKGIPLRSAVDLRDSFPDALGLRIITDGLDEFHAVDSYLQDAFEVIERHDRAVDPDGLGASGVEYVLRLHAGDEMYPLEVQLRTFLQHYWAVRSFHLFHKQPPEIARPHAEELHRLAALLGEAENVAVWLRPPHAKHRGAPGEPWRTLPICTRVHLVVVERGELFAAHRVLTVGGSDRDDHAAIVAAKLDLYARHPGAAIVECSCFDLSAFMLNEPVVRWPADRWSRVLA